MIWLLLPLNFGISWFNAWGCGKSWYETKAVGGGAHFMNWMGAIMSACGFTWCYLLVFGFMAAQIPITDEETGVSAPLLTMEQVGVFFDLGYLIIIFPILGSGVAIMVNSWRYYWQRRSLGSGVVAGWNTYANLSNFYHAVHHVPRAWGNVTSFFGGGSSSSSSGGDKGKAIVAILAVAAVLAGVLTTYTIITYVSKSTALKRHLKYQELENQQQTYGPRAGVQL